MKYVNAEVPFSQLDNHQVITDFDIANNPWVWEFIKRFKHCFERSEFMQCYVFYPEGVPK